ncbi:MAG TPA: mannose-1-phosphate guanyltransferase, partial [Actinomycetota bacterium]|nr:mannose-1-phosphate guanyltransferase [Actinomycetota bacterium]
IERVFFRDDFRRAFPDEIGELRYPPRALEFYQAGILSSLDSDAIRMAGIKSVIDCAFGPSAVVLPALLGRLGSETLIVNGYVDEARPTVTTEAREEMLSQVAELVRTSRAQFGALLETSGENLTLVAEGGRPMPQVIALMLMVDLVADTQPGSTIVVPVSAPAAIETIVGARGGTVVRSQRSPSSLLRAARQAQAAFAGTEHGSYTFPDVSPAFDGLAAFCALHELLARTETSMVERIASLPQSHVVHKAVPTAWDQKGTVMRRVAGEHRADRTDETEGLKFFHGDDWALVIPDPEEPVTHVWAESASDRESEAMAAQYISLVEEALD